MPTAAGPLNLNLYELLSARLQTLATEPAVTPGRIYFNSSTNMIGIGNAAGTGYVYVGAAGALDAEQVQDIVGAMIGTATNIAVAYDDPTGKLTFSVAADGSAATPTLRTLGTGSTQAAPGNDSRFHTHSNSAILDAITAAFTTAMETKLAGIATGANVYTDTNARANRLDQFAAPTAAVSMNSQKITNLATPTADTDAATKAYADSVASGLDVKPSVRATTTGNITLTGTQTVDGVALVAGDRVLVKNQTTGSQNGIYTVAAGAWARATDADATAEVHGGMFTFVEQGTTNADTGWVLTTDTPVTVGTTALTFAQFSGAGTWTAGAGLTSSGTTFNVGAGTGIVVNADDVAIDPAVVARKYTTLVGNGALTAITVTHNLNSRAATVTVMNETTGEVVLADVFITGVNTVSVTFGTAPTTNQYRVTVVA